MKAFFDKITHYYKYVYTDWTQPTLTANGSFEGNSMAVALNFGGGSTYGTAYKCFSPNTDLAGFYRDEKQSWMEVQMYFPNPIRIKTITFNNPDTRTSESGAMVGTTLYAGRYKGSHEKTYLSMGKIYGTYTNNDIPDNGYYKYYSIYFKNEGSAYNDRVEIRYINISGIERTTITGTPTDYDYKVDTGDIYLTKKIEDNVDKYYALKSWEKGQYYGN